MAECFLSAWHKVVPLLFGAFQRFCNPICKGSPVLGPNLGVFYLLLPPFPGISCFPFVQETPGPGSYMPTGWFPKQPRTVAILGLEHSTSFNIQMIARNTRGRQHPLPHPAGFAVYLLPVCPTQQHWRVHVAGWVLSHVGRGRQLVLGASRRGQPWPDLCSVCSV